VYHGHGIVGTKKNKDCMSNDQSRKNHNHELYSMQAQ
jgi:hypothetical protein